MRNVLHARPHARPHASPPNRPQNRPQNRPHDRIARPQLAAIAPLRQCLARSLPLWAIALVAPGQWAQAQVIPDSSPDGPLSPEVSLLSPLGPNETLVGGGALRGNSLFHRFQAFNVAPGRSLWFANPEGVSQIFSYVTGNQRSEIWGTLGVLGNADLFLLNPNGILFGPEAQLNLAGSFVGSTATAVRFENAEWNGTQPSPPLLTLGTPVGLTLGAGSAPIINQSVAHGLGLSVAPQKTLALVGGGLAFPGGQVSVTDGRIELWSGSSGLVDFVAQGGGYQFQAPAADLFAPTPTPAPIGLGDRARLVLTSEEGNPDSGFYGLHLWGGDITVADGSQIRSDNRSGAVGAPIVMVGDRLTFASGGQLYTHALADGPGGALTLTGRSLTLTGADPLAPLTQPSAIFSITETLAQGGAIQIDTDQLLFTQRGQIHSVTAGSAGRGGDITIQARSSLIGQGLDPLTQTGGEIRTVSFGPGPSGNIGVTTALLLLGEDHQIDSFSWLEGPGGNLTIQADSVALGGASPAFPEATSGLMTAAMGSGAGGHITVAARDIEITESGLLVSLSVSNRDALARRGTPFLPALAAIVGLPGSGLGDAGNVSVQADTIRVEGFSEFAPDVPSSIGSITIGRGKAGDVTVHSRALNLHQGGVVASSNAMSAFTFAPPFPGAGEGDGGDVTVVADTITVAGVNPVAGLGSLLGTQVLGSGNAGNTQIQTRLLRVLDGASVSAGTYTSGNAGRLAIAASEAIEVSGGNASGNVFSGNVSTIGTFAATANPFLQAAFFLSPFPEGATGELSVGSPQIRLSHGGQISVAHEGTGNAGNLHLEAGTLSLSDRAAVSAQTLTGNGGNLELNIQDLLLLRRGSQITAEVRGGSGNGGNLRINAGWIVAPALENSDIVANAREGNGGSITIQTNSLLGISPQRQLTPRSDITASSELGINGIIDIETLAFDLNEGLVELPTALLDTDEPIATHCSAKTPSQFVMTGRGGLRADPRQQWVRPTALQDWREPRTSRSSSERLSSESVVLPLGRSRSPQSLPPPDVPRPTTALVEAQGWEVDGDGVIHIIAARPDLVGTIETVKSPCSPSEASFVKAYHEATLSQ